MFLNPVSDAGKGSPVEFAMSDENNIDSLQEQLHDIVADLDHESQAIDKQEADRRALEARRRIEALREERQLEKDLADYSYDFDD